MKYDVLAIGELNVDLILSGMTRMPVPGQEVLAEKCSLTLGSSTAICASGISRLGLMTGFVGKIGRDKFGDVVVENLKKNGIIIDSVIVDDSINTGITVSLSSASDRALVTYLGSIESLKLQDINLDLLKDTRHIHVGSFFLQNNLRPGLAKLFKSARELGVTTSLDSGWDETGNWDYDIADVLKYTDIFFPNEVEAPRIAKKENLIEALDYLSGFCRICVIKCGPDGAIAKWGDKVYKQKPFDLKAVDKTGAGDSFNAGFIYGFIKGLDIKDCMTYGNACGSISVTRLGGASSCPTIDEVEQLIKTGKFII